MTRNKRVLSRSVCASTSHDVTVQGRKEFTFFFGRLKSDIRLRLPVLSDPDSSLMAAHCATAARSSLSVRLLPPVDTAIESRALKEDRTSYIHVFNDVMQSAHLFRPIFDGLALFMSRADVIVIVSVRVTSMRPTRATRRKTPP